MSYNSDKKIEQLDILTSLATDDYLIAGDTSDSGRAKAITKANFTTDMGDETQTLTNKTIALGSNTVSGTLAEFNAALTGADFATGGGTATGTNTGDQTNISGNAATVTTNANLTGIVTSTGNATAIANKAISYTKLADGTDGELITWNSSGVITTVATGTATHVLTSNGAGAAPTFQAASGGATIKTFINGTSFPNDDSVTALPLSSNTTAYFWSFSLPFSITVNELTFSASGGGGTPTTFDIAVYSENGQTKLINITTASNSAAVAVSTAVASVALTPGNYYVAMVANTDVSTQGINYSNLITTLWDNLNGFDQTSKPKYSGTATVTAGTLPATFDPVAGLTEIANSAGPWLPFRLDN